MKNPSDLSQLEFNAKYIWPIQRLFVKYRLAKRCKRCIISEKLSPLENGLCKWCRDEKKTKLPSISNEDQKILEKDFRRLIHSIEGKAKGNYDILLLFSGGKDSTFMLHRFRKEYPKLRILALTVDNSFLSPIAVRNASRASKKLLVDHLIFKPNPELFTKMFRYILKNHNDADSYSVIDGMSGSLAHNIGAVVAANYNIPFLITGMSPSQVERIVGIQKFQMPTIQSRGKITELYGIKLNKLFSKHEIDYWWNIKPASKMNLEIVFPFVAWGYNEQFVRREVLRLGLIEPGNESPLVTNTQLISLMFALDFKKRGFSSFEPEFASAIRAGKANRKYWLSLFEIIEYQNSKKKFMRAQIDYVLAKLDLSRREVGLE